MPSIETQLDEQLDPQKVVRMQSEARVLVATRVWDIWWKTKENRDREQEMFRDRTLKDFINDCVKRFIQFKRRPPHKKNWQSNLASSTPNEKIISVLSKIATRGMEVRVVTQKEISAIEMMKERVSNLLLKAAAIKNDDDFQIILEMMEAAEKGTVIGFEDWYHGKKKIREIIDQDPETGELSFKVIDIKEWNDVRSSLVNLEDFYPQTLYCRPGKIQDLDFCFLRTIMSDDEFQAEFGKYPDADKVLTRVKASVNESTPFWRQSGDVKNDQVEVVRYFNNRTDEYVILANEIWINPVKTSDVVSPLPWNHKQLPFWGGVFEPFDANYFYGRPMVDKLISFADSKDAILDRIIDQMTMSVSKPIITDGQTQSALTKGFLQPNNVITTDWTNGRPNFEVLPINDVPQSAISLYQIMQQNLESTSFASESSSAAMFQGKKRGKKTATQVSNEEESAREIVSLFLKLMECAIRDKARLRFPNMLQFYSLPSNKKESEIRFKKVILRDEKLLTGKMGSVQLEITPKPNQARTVQRASQVAEPVEFIEASPKFLRNIEGDVEIVPQSSIKMTEQKRQEQEILYQRVMMEMYPDKLDRDYGFEELNLKFGKDPVKAKVKQQPMGGIGAPAGQGAAPAPALQPSGAPAISR